MNIRSLLLLFTLLVATAMPSLSQQTTSPYSMYGYGLIGDRATSMQSQMGGVGYAMQGGRQINAMNPASYAAIDSLTFLWDMGASIDFTWRKEGELHERVTGGGLDYVTMQFPICKYMGGSIGLLPYSSVGYAFGDDIRYGAMENQGTGGINEAYLGVAGTYAGVSLGVNVAYAFGTIQNDVFTTPNTSGNTLFEHIMQVRDWNIVIGAQYTYKIDRFSSVTAGVTYSPKKSLHGRTWATIQETNLESVPDTVGYSKLAGRYYLPNTVGAGVSWKRERTARVMVEADVTWQQWSKAPYAPLVSLTDPDRVVFDGMKFNDRLRFSAGAEYVPRVRGSYLQRVAYRIGAYVARDYLRIQGNSVREYGVTCGFGLHTPQDKTMINLGLEWKHRSAHPVTLVSENYLNVTLGLNFNELWFWQRKIR